jgi:hypothetical protein
MFAGLTTSSLESGNRWGSGDATFKSISIDVTEKHVTVDCAIDATVDIDSVLIEVNVRDSKNLVATAPDYTKEERKFDVKAGKTKHVIFTFDNMFGGKTYHINANLKSSDGRQVYDWWRNAVRFTNPDRPKVPTMYPVQIKKK